MTRLHGAAQLGGEGARDTKGQRRTECLWMSYPEAKSFAGIAAAKATARQPSLGGIL